MRNSCTRSINLNVNLINFPSPIQLSMNQKIGKSSLQQPKAKNLNNQSLPIHKKQSSSFDENFEDSFEQFHPTMSTESLCKVKKIYQKSIKNKGFGKSLDDFLNADVEDIVRKNSKTAVIKQLNSKNQAQSNVSSRQNTSKSNHGSQQSSKISSRNSTQHMVSKQPQQIQCYNTFQEDEDFVKFDLLKNSLNVNRKSDKVLGKDVFKKNKSKGASLNNEKSFPNNLCDSEGHKPFIKSKQYKCTQDGQQNKPFSNNIKRSKSKSCSKSKQKSKEKNKNEVLRKVQFAKNIKSVNPTSKQLSSKSPIRHNTSRSPARGSQIDDKKHKQLWKLNGKKETKRRQSKSRSKSKSKNKDQKKFVRSNIQIEISNHHTFSPSPATKRGNKSKSFQRSRSISNHKSLSKQKRSISKSANSKNINLNKQKSPKKKNIVKEFNIKSKDLTNNESKQMNKSRSLSKQKHKRSIANEEKTSSREKKRMKKTEQKQKMTKQYSEQILKSSQFSKNKYKKIVYGKVDVRSSPAHLRSTNFYLPERKESIKQRAKEQKQIKWKKQAKQQRHQMKNSLKINQKTKSHTNPCKPWSNQQTIRNAAITIQRFFRGYLVRKQLNQDLHEICKRVEEVRGKIEDKRSKYWVRGKGMGEGEGSNNQMGEREGNNKEIGRRGSDGGMMSRAQQQRMIRERLRYNQSRKQQFQSLLSSSNSIQHLAPATPLSSNNLPLQNSNSHLQNSISRSINIQHNSKSQLVYLEELVKKDKEQNDKFFKESQQFKQHIRSISGEHYKTGEHCGDYLQKQQDKQYKKYQEKNNSHDQEEMENHDLINHQSISPKPSQNSIQQKQPSNQPLSKPPNHPQLPHLQPFQFYSPTHYILSPKNPSPSLLRMVSPISSASSFHNMQIPFSLQSPQNILNGENLGSGRDRKEGKGVKERYFGAVNEGDRKQKDGKQKNEKQREERDKNISQHREKSKEQVDVQRKIEMLKKLYYQDKLLSPRSYEQKLNALKCKRQNNVSQTLQNLHESYPSEKIPDLQQIAETDQAPSTGKKLKITQLTEQLNQGSEGYKRESVSRVLFGFEQNSLQETEKDGQKQGAQICVIRVDEGQERQQFGSEQQDRQKQRQQQERHKDLQQQQAQEQIGNHQPNTTTHQRLGFPTELIFIKNYLFQFFNFIKSHPNQQKLLLTNLLSIPYDNQHLLTCYRTQLAQIDSDYYDNRIEGQFLAYPYWKNLIDYDPIVGTEVFQRFSQWVEQKNKNQQQGDQQPDNGYFCVTEEQEERFGKKFTKERMSLKEIQRIFLMMLMDAFNEAFQEERCAYRQIGLVRHEKGGMANQNTVRQALKKVQQIENIEKSAPIYYINPTDRNAIANPSPSAQCQQSNLQSSNHYQFFLTHSLRNKKQQLIDIIFCSVLKRVLQNWGRCMCGLIIQPQDQDEMHITIEQIQFKNTERLCLALNKYVQEYQRDLKDIMREHQLCVKLVLADRVLEAVVTELAKELQLKTQQKLI